MKLNRAWLTSHSILLQARWAGLITAVAVLLAVMRGVDVSSPLTIVARILITFAIVLVALMLFQIAVAVVRWLSQGRRE